MVWQIVTGISTAVAVIVALTFGIIAIFKEFRQRRNQANNLRFQILNELTNIGEHVGHESDEEIRVVMIVLDKLKDRLELYIDQSSLLNSFERMGLQKLLIQTGLVIANISQESWDSFFEVRNELFNILEEYWRKNIHKN